MGLKSALKKVFAKTTYVSCPIMVVDNSSKLADKNIVITGGGSGIGKAIAKLACEYGANVLIVGRNEEKLIRVAKEVNCKYLKFDITAGKTGDFLPECEKVLAGKIHALVNNAGVYVPQNSLNYSESDFDAVITTNVKAPFLISQLFVKYCFENHIEGNIVFTTSNRSLMGDDGPYGMSKSAINNFIEGLARENILKGIRVNGVAPGMTSSEINHIDPEGNMYTSSSKCQRVIRAEEIANVVTFLLSDESKCITGAIIPCDCGDRLR